MRSRSCHSITNTHVFSVCRLIQNGHFGKSLSFSGRFRAIHRAKAGASHSSITSYITPVPRLRLRARIRFLSWDAGDSSLQVSFDRAGLIDSSSQLVDGFNLPPFWPSISNTLPEKKALNI